MNPKNDNSITLKPLVQRLKQKKKQLTARINCNNNKVISPETDKVSVLEAKIDHKRKNPFVKSVGDAKRFKSNIYHDAEDSLLDFINKSSSNQKEDSFSTSSASTRFPLQPADAKLFANFEHHSATSTSTAFIDEDETALLEKQKYTKHLPMDWSLKTRIRFFCQSELPATQLKTNQAASSLTSFVRCINTETECGGLDISPAARFNQASYYWQHPHIPWMTLFPRNSRDNGGFVLGERERSALAEEWDYSFKGLFQLLRARQCAYFYLCANSFTVLFRAAGTGGRAEVHALMSPSTHGIRNALRQEGIEFTMPLKKDTSSCLNESLERKENAGGGGVEDDDGEEEEWLESLGVDEKEIRKIQTAHQRKLKSQEMADDFSENSLLLIEGVECQGFFSFLLNAKSTISTVGRLAGVPPTLLAPVAFPKATMQHLTARSSKVRLDGVDYYSIEVKGVVLPSFLPYICQLLKETKSTFSATIASSTNTLSFTKGTQKLLESEIKQNANNDVDGSNVATYASHCEGAAGQVFNKENLSDCGLQEYIIESMCRTGQQAVALLERICCDREHGYAWS